jgi:threonylcarbamoyladenosine tRNA methylthiotransferase MtaB
MTTSNQKTALLYTLGCKVNQVESAQISYQLQRQGYRVLSGFTRGRVDFAIVNTCAVTHKAEAESRRAIARIAKAVPSAVTVVTGCAAHTGCPRLFSIRGVDYVFGNSEKDRIVCAIDFLRKNGAAEIHLKDMTHQTIFQDLGEGYLSSRTRSFIKIQDGCDSFCSYCVVPYARGRSRSMPLSQVLERVSAVSFAGCKEIVLTGVHLGRYGADLTPASTLLEVIREAESRVTETRFRLSSLEPMEMTASFLEVMKASPLLCPHLHLPLQSGDSEVLRRMNRHYTPSFYRQVVEAVLDAVPLCSIGADVMVGFPGEDLKAFENTYELIKSLPLSYLHVFPYSQRSGTAAAGLPDQVPEEEKKRRGSLLRDLGFAKKRAYFNSLLGRYAQVVVQQGPQPGTGLLQGLSERYVPVFFEGGKDLLNQLVWLRLVEVRESKRGPVMLGKLESL